MVTLLVEHGHNEYEVLHNYPIDKVIRYVEAIEEREAIKFFLEAKRLYNIGIFVSPLSSEKDAKKREKLVKEYFDEIHPEKVRSKKLGKKKIPMTQDVLSIFKIPVVEGTQNKKKESDSD